MRRGGGGGRKQRHSSKSSASLSPAEPPPSQMGVEEEMGSMGTEDEVLAEITPSPPLDEDGEEIYIVEKIKDKRVVEGKVQYFLKWQGYGP